MKKKTRHYLDRATIQQEELNILVAFTGFCDRYNLYYSLDCGTLLGAIRHKGFIPWDDDIDLSMPRPDYEKLLQMRDLLECETGYKLSFFGRDEQYAPFVKVVNPSIRVETETEGKKDSGLWIDIFPFDGIVNEESYIKETFSQAAMLKMIFWISESKWALGETTFRKIIRACASPFVLLFGIDKRCARNLYKLSRSVDYEKAEYIDCIAWGFDHMAVALEKRQYESSVKVEFCSHQFKSMSCWDEYLTAAYGDYLQLPPEDKRIAHEIKAWRVEE